MNPVLLQKQLKDNASDLESFYKDLENWGEEMKRKESEIKDKPDISLKKTKNQPGTKIIEAPKQKVQKIGSTDYQKWDKFDADLECERLEDDIQDDSELTDEFEESSRDEALVHKEKGNSYVKTKQWDKAIEFYTRAINCYSYDPVFYANRALCYLKKENFAAAEKDCNLSLKLDGTYVKALQRRAAARENLGKLELAKNDLEMVLLHEPKNRESATALQNLKKKLEVVEELVEEQRPVSKFTASRSKIQTFKPTISNITPKTEIIQKKSIDMPRIDTSDPSTSVWPDPGCEIIPVKAIKKPPHLRSKKPLKRIEITEFNNFLKPKTEAPVKKHVIEKVKVVTFEEKDENASEPIEVTSAFKQKRKQIKNENNRQINEEAWPNPKLQNHIIKSEDLKVLEKKPEVVSCTKEVIKPEISVTKEGSSMLKDKNYSDTKSADANNKFLLPKTSVQFITTWKNLKTSEEKYKYLKLINPSDISSLFQESLESNVFSSILDVMSTKFIENGEDVYPLMNGLTKVRRFSTLTMFLDSSDKNRLWNLISYLRGQETRPKEEVDDLVLKYEL